MLKGLLKKISRKKEPAFITVVSGLPRSGTSMMMKMLEAGGISPIVDHQRAPDEDNPKGYYEFERVKELPKGDSGWLKDANGKSVKIITALLDYLPEEYTFRIIFMERAVEEVLASQKKMLVRRGEDPNKVSDQELTELFQKHLQQTEAWIREHSHHVTCLKVSYNGVLKDPKPYMEEIGQFLGKSLDTTAMAAIADPTLYRHRGTNSSPS